MSTSDGLPTGGERETVDQRMRDLHDRLKAEGRGADAKVLDDAAWAIEALEMDRALARQGGERELLRRSLEYLGHYDVCDCRLPDCSCGMRMVERAIQERLAASPPEASREPRKTWPLTGEPEWHAEDCPCFADHPDMGNHGDCTCGYQPVPPVEPEGSTSPASNVSASSSA